MKSSRVLSLLLAAGLLGPAHAAEVGAAWVRHAPVIRGRIDGSIQVMMAEEMSLSGAASVRGDLRVLGRPTIKVSGAASYGALTDLAAGPNTPAFAISLEGGATVQRIVRGVTPVALVLPVPLRPVTGTRSVALARTTDSAGDFTTVRNLTVGPGAGSRSIPAGAYGDLTVEAKGSVVLGVAGAVTPVFYQFAQLQIAAQASVVVVGPVVVTVAGDVSCGGVIGSAAQPIWLRLNTVQGNLSLAAGATGFGRASVPAGAMLIAGKAIWSGGLEADRLIVEGGAELRLTLPENQRPQVVLTDPRDGARGAAWLEVTCRAAAFDVDGVITRVEFILDGKSVADVRAAPFFAVLPPVPPGEHSLVARASDESGASAESAPARLFTEGNRPPVVALTQPLPGTEFEAPASLQIAAVASDSDGVVQRVEFWLDGGPIGIAYAAPWGCVARDVGEGAHRLKARAFDNLGASADSPEVAVNVRPRNLPPVVTLATSWGAAVPTAPAEVTLTATATDADGVVTSVVFLRDGVKVGEVQRAPFSLTLSGVDPGTYSFTARATDDRSATAVSSSVVLTINQAPAVSLTQPAAGAVFDYPASITLQADATDADGRVIQVEFWRAGSKLGAVGAAPFGMTWSGMPPGVYEITARATDDRGAMSTSAVRVVQVRVTIPYFTGFELIEGYPAGRLDGLIGWSGSGEAKLMAGEGRGGGQALVVGGAAGAGEARRTFPVSSAAATVLFAECWLRPAAGVGPAEGMCVRLGPSTLALVRAGGAAEFQVMRADGVWVSTGLPRLLDAAGEAAAWTRVTVRQDFAARVWDLWLDGQLVAIDLPMPDLSANDPGTLVVVGRLGGVTRLDDFYVGFENPLFPDADHDGIDDGWEMAHGLDPRRDDRGGDPDGDGLSNVREYLLGTDPLNRDTDGDGFPDGWEVAYGFDPRRANAADEDVDGDGLGLLEEFRRGTHPRLADTDGDGVPDGWEVLMGSNPLVADLATMPSQWRGVRLHLRADAGVAVDTSGAVTSWRDQSARSGVATASSSVRAPRVQTDSSGRTWVQFDGFDDWLSLPNFMAGAVAGDIFAVVQQSAAPAGESRTVWTLGSAQTLYPHSSGGVLEAFGSASARLGPTPLFDPMQPHLYEVAAKASGWTSRINGQVYLSLATNTVAFSSTPSLGYSGGSNFGRAFAGGIAEIIAFDRELTADERCVVQRYFNVRHRLLLTAAASPRLEVAPCGAGQVCLMWTADSALWGTRYEVERRVAAQAWQRVAVVEDALTWIDGLEVSFQGAVAYRIRAINAAGPSDWSSVVEATLVSVEGEVVLPRAGLRLWLKADSGVPLGRVNRWPDLSGRGQDALANPNLATSRVPLAEAGMLRGRPAVHFDGYDDFLELPSTLLAGATAGEAWVVLRAAALPATENRTLWRLGGADTLYPGTDGSILDGFGSTVSRQAPAPRDDLGTWRVYQVAAEKGRWSSRSNGRIQWIAPENTVAFGSSPTLGYSGSPTFGRSFNGHVAEILVYDRVLSQPEREALARYLQARFGLAASGGNANVLPPTALRARPVGPNQVALRWTLPPAAWATVLELQRQEADGAYSSLPPLTDTASYVDRDLKSGATYRYRARASTPVGVSAWSETVALQMPGQGSGIPLSALRLWLSADAGLLPGRVGLWCDQSGRGFRGYQLTADYQPEAVLDAASGRMRVRFDALNDSLVLDPLFAGMSEGEIFAVLKARAAQPAAARVLWTLGPVRTLYPHESGHVYEGFGSSVAYDSGSPRVPIEGVHLYNVTARAGDWFSRLNGGSYFSKTGNTVGFRTDPSLGYSANPKYGSPFDGEIAELMVFERALTAEERDAVGGFLAAQHGFGDSLLPPTPQGVVLEQVSASQIRVAWRPLTLAGGSTVIVERSVDGGAYSLLGEVTGRSAYVDRGLAMGSRVRFRLRSRSLGGLSDYSFSEEYTVAPSSVASELPCDGIRLWLRADHGVEAQSGSVAAWRDQSGFANDAFQLDVRRRPLAIVDGRGGVTAVRFDGLDDMLALPDILSAAAAGELLAVLKAGADFPGAPRGLWRFVGDGAAKYPDGGGLIWDDFGGPVVRPLLPAPWPLTQWRHFDVAAGAGRWTAWLNGLALHDSIENTVSFRTDPLIGHNGVTGWDGDLAEIIVYDRVLTPAERESAGAHLAQRYSLPDLVVAPPPTELKAFAAFPFGVALTWNARVDGVAVRFVVERQEAGGVFQPVGVVANSLGWSDGGALAGKTYSYRVKALTFGGPSAYAGPVSIVLPVDSDGDGLPDSWEIRAGTNPLIADAQFDPDGDGLNNRQEYRLGSNPMRKASADPGLVNLRVYQPEREE